MAPVFWLLFGAGGMLSALFGPALIVLTGFMLPHGWGVPANFADYDHVLLFARNPIAKLVLFGIIALFFWHGAERMFLTLKDMRAGPLLVLRLATYGVAALLTLVTLALLLAVGF
jgi:fumarate reductase subunit D